jgi:hypothetical protein
MINTNKNTIYAAIYILYFSGIFNLSAKINYLKKIHSFEIERLNSSTFTNIRIDDYFLSYLVFIK